MVRAPMAKPPITANQVTLLRLVLLPIGGLLLYGTAMERWGALAFMTVLGCTDFIDGWLARRYGSTELGRLMDPIADKVFIVVSFMPFIHHGWMTPWEVGLLLAREYIVTGLRSAFERHNMTQRTSLLAKIKTWVQMAGGGVVFMMWMAPRDGMIVVLSLGVGLPLLCLLLRFIIQRYFWWGTLVFSGWMLAVLLPYIFLGTERTAHLLTLTMIGITWLSGWGYVAPVLPKVFQGKFDGSDWVRILGSLLIPLVLVAALTRENLPDWAIILTMSLEMAVGGLDNLLCAKGAQCSALAWGARVGLVAGLVGAAYGGAPAGPLLCIAACGVSAVGTAVEFWRGRSYYMEEPAPVIVQPGAAP